MIGKRNVLIYGTVLLPVEKGKTATYYNNGQWKETGRVTRVNEVHDEYIKFETDRIKYCIRYQREEAVVLSLSA